MGIEGYMAELSRRGADGEEGLVSIQLPTWLNPYIPKSEIRKLKRSMRDKAFRQEVGAEMLADSGMVFDRQDLAAICQGQLEDPRPGCEYFGGLDLGVTNDPSVLTIAREPLPGENPQVPRVVFVQRYHRIHIEGLLNKVHAVSERYNSATINVDHNGIGQSIYQQMLGKGTSVRPVYTTGQGANAKINQITHAMTVVEQGRLMLPAWDSITYYLKELTSYQWEETPSGNKTANAPEGMHDDCVASFLLLCWWLPPSDGTQAGQVWHRGKSEVATLPEPGKKQRPEFKVSGDADPEEFEAMVYSQQRQGAERRALWGNPLASRRRNR
jgi:hypothetical protein